MEEDKVEPMMLGSIASQYYLSFMTLSMFGSNIGPDTSLEVSHYSWLWDQWGRLRLLSLHCFSPSLLCRYFCIFFLLLLNMMNFLCGIMR